MTSWRLRRGVYLAAETEQALFFYHLGRRIEIRCGDHATLLHKLSARLAHPLALDEILREPAARPLFDSLREAGLLVQAENAPEISSLAEFEESYLGGNAEPSSLERWRATPIRLIDAFGLSELAAVETYRDALAFAGFENVSISQTHDGRPSIDELTIALGTWLKPGPLEHLNCTMLSRQTSWLLVTEDEFGGSVGPFFGNARGPCWNCLKIQRERHIAHLRNYHRCQEFFATSKHLPLALPVFRPSLAAATATEVMKYLLTPDRARTDGGAYEFDHLNHRVEFHALLVEPGCPVCRPAPGPSPEGP